MFASKGSKCIAITGADAWLEQNYEKVKKLANVSFRDETRYLDDVEGHKAAIQKCAAFVIISNTYAAPPSSQIIEYGEHRVPGFTIAAIDVSAEAKTSELREWLQEIFEEAGGLDNALTEAEPRPKI